MIKVILTLFLAYCSLILLVYIFQDKLIFFPDKTPLKKCPLTLRPGIEAKSIEFAGTSLNFYIREMEKSKFWFLHFHGNAGRACDREFVFNELEELPLNIVLMEYPGYSQSSTDPSEKSILKNGDVAMRYFQQKKELPFFLFGESLGTGVATYLAAKFEVAGLILQSPFPSLSKIGQKAYPFLPIKLLLKHNFPAEDWAIQVKSKVLILHGEMDGVIPLSLGIEQGKNFKSGYDFQIFKERGHNDLAIYNPEFWDKVRSFIEAK